MLNNKFVVYESLNLERVNTPSHSRLYSLEPIGLGTPYVESLTGYIARLAQEHSVPTGVLVLSEVAPFLKEGYVFHSKDGGLDQIFANQARAINGTGIWTVNIIKALESLTLQHNLCCLTMLTWEQVIPKMNLLHPVRAWCPSCYEHWYANKQIIYEPLLWSLNEVTVCPLHHQYLQTRCPHCEKENRLLAWYSRPGYCSKCREWLGTSSDLDLIDNRNLTKADIKWQAWVAQNFGDLIAAAPNLSPPSKNKISQSLNVYVNTLAEGNITAFAQKLGKGRTQTHRWCVGKSLPTIDTLLHICFQLDISLLNLLTDEVKLSSSHVSMKNQSKLSRKNIPHIELYTSQEVINILKDALTRNPPPSLKEVAKSLGYKQTTVLYYHSSELSKAIAARHTEYKKTEKIKRIKISLDNVLSNKELPPPPLQEVVKLVGVNVASLKLYFPEQCNTILQNYATYCKDESKKRIKKLQQKIRLIAFELNAKGIEPTASRISEHLDKPAVILQKEAIAAVRKVRRELGWEE